jgi:hypothetical protein
MWIIMERLGVLIAALAATGLACGCADGADIPLASAYLARVRAGLKHRFGM